MEREGKPIRDERYARTARLLHWIVAALVPIQFQLGWTAERTQEREAAHQTLHTHFRLGAAIFALMLLRLLWRAARGAAAPLVDEPRWRRRTAGAVHWALYALLLILPISGYVGWVWMGGSLDLFGPFALPRIFTPPVEDETWRAIAAYLHTYSAWAIATLVALHIAAALWHEVVRGDALIQRRMF